MTAKLATLILNIVVALFGALFLSSPLYALTAEQLLENPRYESYVKLLDKYYQKGEKRRALIKEFNAIMAEFDVMRQKVKDPRPFKYKIGTLAPEGTAWIALSRDFQIPFLEEVSGGRMGTTLYTGGVMGEDKDVLRKMKMGQLHGCGCSAQGILSAAPELSVFSLPFLFRNYQEVDYVLAKFRKDIESILEKKGYMLYTLVDTGNFYVFTKDKAPTLEDLKRLKWVTWFGNVESTFLSNLGITPIPLPVPEVIGGLRTGMVNADIAPAAWILGMQANTSLNYFLEQPVSYSVAGVIMEKRALDQEAKRYGISKKDEDRMAALSLRLNKLLKSEEIWNETLRKFEKESLELFKQTGMKPLKFSDEEMRAMETAGRKTWYDLAGKDYSKALLDKVIATLEEYRKNQSLVTSH